MKGLFSKIVVVYCITFCSVMSIWAMYIADTDKFLCTGVLVAILGVFGGELLLLCLKRIYDIKVDKTTKYKNIERDCE